MKKNSTPNSEAETNLTVRQKSPPLTKARWQERLLPVMGGLLIGLTIFFFAASFIQLTYLHISILNYPALNINPASGAGTTSGAKDFDEQMQARRLELNASMEAYVVGRRYHQAGVLLMAGLWVRYLGFVTGMILALVGASFVLGRMSEPVSAISGKTALLDFSMRSASPGIILVALGVVLMFATITDRDKVEVNDGTIYLNNSSSASGFNFPKPTLYPTLTIPDELLLPEDTPTPVGP